MIAWSLHGRYWQICKHLPFTLYPIEKVWPKTENIKSKNFILQLNQNISKGTTKWSLLPVCIALFTVLLLLREQLASCCWQVSIWTICWWSKRSREYFQWTAYFFVINFIQQQPTGNHWENLHCSLATTIWQAVTNQSLSLCDPKDSL